MSDYNIIGWDFEEVFFDKNFVLLIECCLTADWLSDITFGQFDFACAVSIM